MKKTVMAVLIGMCLVSGCTAAPKELQEKVTVTEETNTWDKAISLWSRGETVKERGSIYLWSNVTNFSGSLTVATNYMYTDRITWGYREHTCTCDKAHMDSYPKTDVAVNAVQKLTTTEIYRGTNWLSTTLRYDYPHKKVTTTTTETLKIVTNVSSKVEKTVEEVKCKNDCKFCRHE